MNFLAKLHLQKGVTIGIADLEVYIEKCREGSVNQRVSEEGRAYFLRQIDEAEEAISQLKEAPP